MANEARLCAEPFDPSREFAALMAAASGSGVGAVVSFLGIARPRSKAGGGVDRLFLEHHRTLTLKSLEEIAADGSERFDVADVRVVHRYGAIFPGEPIVFAGAASAHRRAAFECADYLMDRLKTEAVFWKREEGPEGTEWIEPTAVDYADRRRWE